MGHWWFSPAVSEQMYWRLWRRFLFGIFNLPCLCSNGNNTCWHLIWSVSNYAKVMENGVLKHFAAICSRDALVWKISHRVINLWQHQCSQLHRTLWKEKTCVGSMSAEFLLWSLTLDVTAGKLDFRAVLSRHSLVLVWKIYFNLFKIKGLWTWRSAPSLHWRAYRCLSPTHALCLTRLTHLSVTR